MTSFWYFEFLKVKKKKKFQKFQNRSLKNIFFNLLICSFISATSDEDLEHMMHKYGCLFSNRHVSHGYLLFAYLLSCKKTLFYHSQPQNQCSLQTYLNLSLYFSKDHQFLFLTNFIVHWSHASVLYANNPSLKIITLLSKVPHPQLHCTVIWSCGSLSLWYLVQISFAKISVCFT